MNAEIIGENEDGVGVDIIDNNNVTHEISIEKCSGDIVYHSQDGYADQPSGRTVEESEYGSQARRYAKWHVYREREYDTVPPTNNPDRILAALAAVVSLSESEFTDQFCDLQAQIESHKHDATVELPFEDVDPGDPLIYSKDIYLQQDPTTFDPPVLDQFLGRFDGESDCPEIPLTETLDTGSFDALDFDIEAVSGLHYRHNDGLGNEQTVRGEDPLDREPDATVELMAFDPDEIDSFHHYIVSHLAYQIRDCFLLMGVKPPEGFRAQGWGKYKGFTQQKFCPQYENYWSAEETIESWQPS